MKSNCSFVFCSMIPSKKNSIEKNHWIQNWYCLLCYSYLPLSRYLWIIWSFWKLNHNSQYKILFFGGSFEQSGHTNRTAFQALNELFSILISIFGSHFSNKTTSFIEWNNFVNSMHSLVMRTSQNETILIQFVENLNFFSFCE